MQYFRDLESKGVPIMAFTDYVDIEDQAMKQILNLSQMHIVQNHIAVMPDCHWGFGSTVGSVFGTNKAIIPAAVGVDIGCGMIAQKTPLKASDLPDNLFEIRSLIEDAIPHGRTNNGGEGDRGAWHNIPTYVMDCLEISPKINIHYRHIIMKHPELEPKRLPWHQLGTLGTGNHFIELCLDENQDVWIMLHSGSRGIGNKIGTFFIEKAKEEMRKYHIEKYLPDMDLAYLVEKTDVFDDYVFALNWAQKFAIVNRNIMMSVVYNILMFKFPEAWSRKIFLESAINCHHNYVTKEQHFGKNVWLTRKGAVRAREGDLGIIPGSMGAKSFIVRGKGNADSLMSCSHGAGRAMSRNEAKKRFTVEDQIKATEGVECRKDKDVIDEIPWAYKDIDAVMASQVDLVDIVHTLKQIVCVKG